MVRPARHPRRGDQLRDSLKFFGTAWLTLVAQLTFERGHTMIADPADVAIAWVPPDIELVDADAVALAREIIAAHAGETRADDALKNVPFYERHGFRVAAEISTPDGAATLRPMHRAARAPHTD